MPCFVEENMADMAYRLVRGLSRDDLLYLYESLDSEKDMAVLVDKLRGVVEEKLKLKREVF